MGNCEAVTKVDIGNVHRMARARVEINKMLMRLKKVQKQKLLKLDLRVLEKFASPFRLELKKQI